MVLEKLSDRVRQLIGENDQRAAVALLLQAFRDKNAELFNIALVQQANIKKLGDQSAAGILSTEERNREQAKINVALLHLSDEHARLFEGGNPGQTMPRWIMLAAIALLALLLVGWLVKNTRSQPNYPSTFDLTVRLHEPGGEQKAIREGQVKLRLGEAEPQERHPLNDFGEATFRDLSEKYRGDSVQLLYFPDPPRRFKITQQSAAVLSGGNQAIDFTLEYRDTTVFQATLRDTKGPVAGAQITVDGNLHATSDDKGYFEIAIPKASGALAHLLIEKNGQRKYAQKITISPGFHSLLID